MEHIDIEHIFVLFNI